MQRRVAVSVVVGVVTFVVAATVIGGMMTVAVVTSDVHGAIGLACAAVIGLLVGHREYRRRQPQFPGGCCRACGYDLTGNTSGRCPECGREINADSRRPLT
jgi:hypothetical protein